ncbi:MAG: rRNA pseudouridine synthase [Bacteroidetes bacterium]|nr:rRNA pseudouridine synthase [Bacteroidota bacterium]
MGTQVRLNKYLSEAGVCSRRAADELIKEGRIQVNGKRVTELGKKVSPSVDLISVDGEYIRKVKPVYYLFHKPAGYITTVKDERNRKTIFDIIKIKQRVFPIGRLDRDTTGVLILTNDGDFANLLTHPRNKVTREYFATLDKEVLSSRLENIKKVELEDGDVRIEKIFVLKSNPFKVKIVLQEGRNRVVKRIFTKLGYEVKKLHRTNYAGFTIEGLPLGAVKKIHYSKIEEIIKRYEKP